jgi:hypothetical protein
VKGYWAVTAGLAVLATLGFVLRVRARRPRRGQEQAPTAPSSADLPVFDVVALGHRGSGKTMLLTSMYHELQTMAGRSYHLAAPYDQVLMLNDWFGEVADPQLAWPSGTGLRDTRSFAFTVQTRTADGRPLPVLVLNFLDYAGGLLTDPQVLGSTAQAELMTRIQRAHALIGIIDGYLIRQWMDGQPGARVPLQQAITTMINLMLYSDSPITFVVTKWDLLSDIGADEDARLAFVRQALLQNQGFRDLVQTHSSRRTVRLIPVSAVGPAFAELDPSGRVVKLPAGDLRPTNIDAPLAALIPDIWERVERAVGADELRKALAELDATSGRGLVAAMTRVGTTVGALAGRTLGHLAPPAGLALDLATAMHGGDDLDERIARSLDEDRRVTAAERELEANRAARRRVLRELQSRIDLLEGRLPSSRLEPGV